VKAFASGSGCGFARIHPIGLQKSCCGGFDVLANAICFQDNPELKSKGRYA